MVTFNDICEAHERISGVVHRTPVYTSETLNQKCGCSVFLKCENMQKTGSFKFRGASNAVMQLSELERERGVLTFSSGNHAQAMARAGRDHGVAVTVVMPHDAPEAKRKATEGYGAEVILYDIDETSREELARKLSSERGLTVIPPFDHEFIVAGQGTVAKELLEEVEGLDAIIACVGGGGLLSGTAISTRALNEKAEIWGVEPEAGNDVQMSLAEGRLVTIPVPNTIADGARTPSASPLTFGIIKELVDGVVTVSDRSLLEVTHFMFHRMKLVVEPTGALALAALWEGKLKFPGGRVGVTVSGGNCDVVNLASWWSESGIS